jgi:DNA-damage-inducible protein J
MFLHQVVLRKGLPFDVRIPNAESRAAIAEMRDPKRRARLKRYESADAIFADVLAAKDKKLRRA